MRKALRVSVILCLAPLLLASAERSFRFAVVGDRTGGATGSVFEEIIDEVRLLDPDFVMCVGDLIEGYETDTTVMHAQWDTILATIKTLPCKFYFVPGNHEVQNEADRRIYEQRTGVKRYYSFNYQNTHFIVLDNTMTYWGQPQEMGSEQLSWLAKDLEKHKQMDHIFVFYHIPTYIYALRDNTTDTLTQILEKYGVDVVFTGHHHEYSYLNRGVTEYINVGSSGGAMSTNDPARGHFFQYLMVTVRGMDRSIAVMKKESALPRNIVTLEDIGTINRLDEQAVTMTEIVADDDAKNITQEVVLTIENFGPDSILNQLIWQTDPVRYTITPVQMPLAIAPEERKECSFEVRIADGSDLFPMPRFALAYPFTYDKTCTLYN
ncbi:metallophosphoesterase, partial [candidate division WOR-3 bacterium]|nr:metallophosphoesterase [candidate division WOR-3 bacterium]